MPTTPDTVARLQRIDHIVVLMLENRSFDHALGYLSLPQYSEGAPPVNGLRSDPLYANAYTGAEYPELSGRVYPTAPLYPPGPRQRPALTVHWQDPPHEAPWQDMQINSGAMDGFVNAYAGALHKRRAGHPTPHERVLGYPMGYLTKGDVPVYDHLAKTFCVCDNWFCSVRGPTMTNRFFAVAGTTDGILDNAGIVLHHFGQFRSFFRHLPPGSWRWYSSDPAVLRAIDDEYTYDDKTDRFAYFDQFTGRQSRSFLSDLFGSDDLEPDLKPVSWIDPNFAASLEPGQILSNDDHPPTRPIHGQKLVNKVYEALRSSKYRENTMLVVTYDEHGGFYDHEPPPPKRYRLDFGPRVPALVIADHVKPGVCHAPFDHASIIKTILLRFGVEGALDQMPDEVDYDLVNDLGETLADDGAPVKWCPVDTPGEAAITEADLVPDYLARPKSTIPRAIELVDTAPTELQELIGTMAVRLRSGVRDARTLIEVGGLMFARFYARLRKLVRPKKKLDERHP